MSATAPAAPRPLRVLFHAHSYPRTEGDVAGSFLLRLARALADEGVTVRVVAPAAPGLAPEETIGGVEVRRFRYAPRRYETLAYTGQMAEQARATWGGRGALAGLVAAGAAAARREVRAWRPDLVHAHWWFPGGLSAVLPGALGGRPLVVTLHGSDVRLARGVAPARRLFAAVAARADAVTAVSSWLCAEAAAMAPGLDCRVAPMPVDAARFLRAASDSPRHGALFVGRLTAQKGVGTLVDALARTRQPVGLTVVGSGPEEAALRARAAQVGVAERIRWVSGMAQAELPTLYASAEAVVMPSVGEGLGLVAVEAMMCGTPVIALRSGGVVDVVQDGETGLLVEPGDVDALAGAIDRITADPPLARRLGATARAFVSERYTPAAAAAAYRAVYDGVCARRSGDLTTLA